MLYNWRPGGSTENTHFVYTTGGNETGHATAATGNRKKLLAVDLINAMGIMDKQKVPRTGRYLAIDYKMYEQLIEDLGYQSARLAALEADMAAGEVLRFAGFRIMAPRSKVLYATANLSATRTPGHAGATTDSAFALAWQVDAVAKALGVVKMFEDEDNPLYYGSIISALLRSGGRKRRNDNYGVLAILQATP
jgi:hypothetical protein